jgi:hypothetical protein
MTAPKSCGQLFIKGGSPFIETVIVEDKATLKRLTDWLRKRGEKHKEPIWLRDADTAEKLDLVLFIGLSGWYTPRACAMSRQRRKHEPCKLRIPHHSVSGVGAGRGNLPGDPIRCFVAHDAISQTIHRRNKLIVTTT